MVELPSTSPIHLDADRYPADVAANRYVKHPSGLPQPNEHWLVIGPRGTGKTIMLKALYTQWGRTGGLLPIYIDLQPRIAKIAGELPMWGQEPLSPRDRAMLDCMSLAVSLTLISKVGETVGGSCVAEATELFVWERAADEYKVWIKNALRKLRESMVSGTPFGIDMPSVFAVANSLGESVSREMGKTLVLLVDQIDQVPAPVFQPIVSLLRRTGSFTTVMASRPCPTAPEEAVMPSDLVAGESYQILSIGRETELETRESLINSVLEKLPFRENMLAELRERSRILAALTWPSLRVAIQICQLYEQFKILGHGDDAWPDSVMEVSRRYEDVVKDVLRAWCANPSELLRKWRRTALKAAGSDAAGIWRGRFRIGREDLFRHAGDAATGFLRMAVKAGILFPGGDERYVLDHLADTFEIAPLLLVSDATKLDAGAGEKIVEWEVRQIDLKEWVTRSRRREVRTKRVFVGYWMSAPEAGPPELQQLLRARLLDAVTVVTGEVHGSPQWSPKILEKIKGCNIAICDLSTPRRDIFVEYGWAIGLTKPVLQVVRSRRSLPEYPPWVTARQFQFYEAEDDKDRLVSSIIRLLNEPPDRVDRWFWEPPNIDMAFTPKPSTLAFLGRDELVEKARRACGDRIAEFGMEAEYLRASDHSGILFECIRKARGAGTLVLLFSGTSDDYLACVAWGDFRNPGKGLLRKRQASWTSALPAKRIIAAKLGGASRPSDFIWTGRGCGLNGSASVASIRAMQGGECVALPGPRDFKEMTHQTRLLNFGLEFPDISKAGAVWIGAVSFEERCEGSLRSLSASGLEISAAVLLDYPTKLYPEKEGEAKRSGNREAMLKLLSGRAEIRRLPSYRFGAMLGLLHELEEKCKNEWNEPQLIFDITCLTKVHALALAYWIATTKSFGGAVVAYTRPRDYGSPIRKIWGKGSWIETVTAPFDMEPSETAEGTVGIILLGHEGDRLRLALHEVGIDEGLLILADSEDPRLSLVAEAQNKWLFDDLEQGRGPRLALKRVPLWDMRNLDKLTSEVVSRAKERRWRLVLFPFGPKPLIFGIALIAVGGYPEGAWYSYPVPRSYDIDYTIGIGTTLWSKIG